MALLMTELNRETFHWESPTGAKVSLEVIYVPPVNMDIKRSLIRIVKQNKALAMNLTIAGLACTALFILVGFVSQRIDPIQKQGSCIKEVFVLFPDLIGYHPNPDRVIMLAQGNEQFIKRIYEHYLKLDWVVSPDLSFSFSPMTVYLVLAFLGLQAQPDLDFGYEELKMGVAFPCSQSRLKTEVTKLLTQIESLDFEAYVDPKLNGLAIQNLVPNARINVFREPNTFRFETSESEMDTDSTTYFLLQSSFGKNQFAFKGSVNVYHVNYTNEQPREGKSEANKYEVEGSNSVSDIMAVDDVYEVKQEEKVSNREISSTFQKTYFEVNDAKTNVKFLTVFCKNATLHRIQELQSVAVTLRSPKTELTTTVILPESAEGWVTLNSYITAYGLDYIQSGSNQKNVQNARVKLRIPQVDFENRWNLALPLQMFKIVSFFQLDETNFEKLTGSPSLKLSEIYHKSRFSTQTLKTLFSDDEGYLTTREIVTSFLELEATCGLPFLYFTQHKSGILADFGRVITQC